MLWATVFSIMTLYMCVPRESEPTDPALDAEQRCLWLTLELGYGSGVYTDTLTIEN